MDRRLGMRVLISGLTVLSLAVLAAGWVHQGRPDGRGSITVKLPPARPIAKPAFSFAPAS
jgi:hypothetical protein